MQNLFREVEKELPLICEREIDIETWSKRWKLLQEKINNKNKCSICGEPCYNSITTILTHSSCYYGD